MRIKKFEKCFLIGFGTIVVLLTIFFKFFVSFNPHYMVLRSSAVERQIKAIGECAEQFKHDCGFYPSTEQGLNALVNPPTIGNMCPNWGPKPYMPRVPLDPWHHEFVYTSDGKTYTLISLGADGKVGGTGPNADISSADH